MLLSTLNYIISSIYVSLTRKDHKPKILNKPETRQLNSAKHKFDRISKLVLDKINLNLGNANKVNKWKNANSVINYLKIKQAKL